MVNSWPKQPAVLERWFAKMTPRDREGWRDLEAELLKAEKLEQEAQASWSAFTGKASAEESYEAHTIAKPKSLPQAPHWQPPPVPTGIIEIDYPPPPPNEPSLNLMSAPRRILQRDDLGRRTQTGRGVGDMPCGFD